MANTVTFTGDQNTDEWGNPVQHEGDGFGNPEDPAARDPRQFNADGTAKTAQQMLDEWKASPEGAAYFAEIPAFMRPKIEHKMLADFARREASNRSISLEGRVEGAVDASTIDPWNDVKYYEPGEKLDLSDAKADLWNPDEAQQESAAAGLRFTESPTDGRDAQVDALDYFGGIVEGDGHDAVSDAEYEMKRADAEQAARAQREAGMQNLEERGMGNSGASVLNELMAARDVGAQGHEAALGAAATAQARRDNAGSSLAEHGNTLQTADYEHANDRDAFGFKQAGMKDDWQQVLGDWNETLGVNTSTLSRDEDTNDWVRTNDTSDKNVGVFNNVVEHNKDLPWKAFDAYKGSAVIGNDAAEGTGEYADDLVVKDDELSGAGKAITTGLQIGGKVKGILSGGPDDEEEVE